jgi:hypothetical protein
MNKENVVTCNIVFLGGGGEWEIIQPIEKGMAILGLEKP